MDRTTAQGAAAGVVLAVVGAVSAFFLMFGGGEPADAGASDSPAVVTEYVDQYGNPVAAPAQAAAAPEVVLVNPDGTVVDANAPAAPMADAYGADEYEEHAEGEEYEEDEDHDEEEYAEGEEYEEHAEGEEYEEDEDHDEEEYEEHEEGDEYPEDEDHDEEGDEEDDD